MALKLNIGTKDGKTHKKELTDDESKALMGKKIGDKISGNSIGFPGYEFEITGGSDSSGFPMRSDVSGTARKKILTTKGTGFHAKKKGLRVRKTVAGNTISKKTVQVNLTTVKYGSKPLAEPAEAPAEEGAEEAPETKEEAPKKEEKEDKPAEKKDAEPAKEKEEDNENKAEKPAEKTEAAEEKEEKPAKEESEEAPKEEKGSKDKPEKKEKATEEKKAESEKKTE